LYPLHRRAEMLFKEFSQNVHECLLLTRFADIRKSLRPAHLVGCGTDMAAVEFVPGRCQQWSRAFAISDEKEIRMGTITSKPPSPPPATEGFWLSQLTSKEKSALIATFGGWA